MQKFDVLEILFMCTFYVKLQCTGASVLKRTQLQTAIHLCIRLFMAPAATAV